MAFLKLTAAAIGVAVLIAGAPVTAQAQVGAGAPLNCKTSPPGTTAICRDRTPSNSPTHQGTCAHHWGVLRWCR
jgi:hypothetical protein